MFKSFITLASASAVLAFAFLTPAHAAPDEEAAKALMKTSDCTKCHSVDKKKNGPTYKEIASKYKGKSGSEAKLLTHITTSPMVELDGKKQEHPKVKSTDAAEQLNLVQWILSR
jgi:cytochrome c